MVHPQRTCSHMELLPLVCLCLLSCSGTTSADPAGTVVVEKGSDVILPCSNNGVNLETESFDWTKGQMKVFSYAVGQHSNKGKPGQAEQFRGRVSHFEEELKHGNASIKITNATMADSGDYTCDFPGVHPPRKSDVKLVVGAPEPYVTSLDATENSAVLQCEAHGVPDLEVHWQDSDGNKLPAEEPQVTERGGLSYITLNMTVTKTDNFYCVATQKNISHRISAKTYVRLDEPDNTWWIVVIIGLVVVIALLIVVFGVVVYKLKQKHKTDMKQLKDDATEKLSDGAGS